MIAYDIKGIGRGIWPGSDGGLAPLDAFARGRCTVGRLIDAARQDGVEMVAALGDLRFWGPQQAVSDWLPLIERQRGAIIAELCRRGPIYADQGATPQ